MKLQISLIAVFALLFPVSMSAQLDTRAPGIYAIVRGESIPLKYSSSGYSSSSRGWFANSETVTFYRGGMTSGVTADNTFVLVNDPEQFGYMANDPFFWHLTPADMVVVRLTVNPEKKRRELESQIEYEIGDVGVVISNGGLEFDWEQISENSYKISVRGLEPGEYGIAFRAGGSQGHISRAGSSQSFAFDYNYGIYGFTIPRGYLEGRITEMNTPIDRDTEYAIIPPASEVKPEKDLKKGGYEKVLWDLEFGYVNKSWICNYPSGRQREDLFGDKGKLLHGMYFGAMLTPSFDWGLGLRTGVLAEAYISKSSRITEYCRDYSEFDLYFPLHLSYRFPFKKDIALTIYGGAGFEWAVAGNYNETKGTAWVPGRRPVPVLTDPKKHVFGNGWPENINWQAELGLNFRFEHIGFSFTYGFGLVDHHLQNSFDGGNQYEAAATSRQDRMQATISMYF